MKRKVIFHLGLPKTGTTFLQREFFQKIEGIRYLGKFDGILDNITLTRKLFYFLFAAGKDEFVLHGIESLKEELEVLEEKLFGDIQPAIPILISDEELVCQILLPRKANRDGFFSLHIREGFLRMKIFQERADLDFHFIYCHRNPADFFHSFYAQFYWYFSRINELNTFEKYVSYGCSISVGKLGFALITQEKLIKTVEDIFIADHILQLKYESFVKDPVNFVDEISSFLMGEKQSRAIDFSIKHNSRKTSGNDAIRFGDTYPHWIPRKSPSFRVIVTTFLLALNDKIFGRDTENIKVEVELTQELRNKFCKRIQE